ncbi:Na+/H+ antiporter NhaC family protein [Natronincola ferrireducens]|uniref:Na+/H+ antiporter NhaC n=1 Tax=Natronincola ferrireducens TaxID=393762 RepID=A0A1G9H1I4_9FIRM|nr:Na+/H+ antiporter NhaC family protein [Natronincola ferrireducens]SDL06684.1 Na+/H+ antiporter NhaC [Natronincola ferrireducens]
MDYGFLSILPPFIAIVLALVFKNVFIALFTGCFIGYIILSGGNIITGLNSTLLSFIKVFESNSNTIVIIACGLIGGLTLVVEKSGGLNGFVDYMTNKRSIIKSKKGANVFAWIVGVLTFTSGTLSCLVTGAISRPINDALKVPHEKLSFIVHTTSTPVCVLLPLSGWGAFMIGLIQAQGVDDAASVMVKSIPLNFYALIAVFSIIFFIVTGKDFGPMKRAEERAEKTGLLDEPKNGQAIDEAMAEASAASDGKIEGKTTSPLNMLVPILTMIVTILAVMFITGEGSIIDGKGMDAILWGVFVSLTVAGTMYISQKIFKFQEYLNLVFQGVGGILPVVSILIFAFSIGGVVKQLGTGEYLANNFASLLSPAILPALVFIIGSLISFATGTSMGTMSIMMPLAVPMALAMGVNVPLVAAAVFGGGIFGDHASPISDTTAMSCATSGCDVMDHIKTQLPYALTFGGITITIYLIMGFLF